MKTYFITLAVVLTVICTVMDLSAQPDLPMPEDSKTRNVSESLNFGATTTKAYSIGNDTIIDDVTWTRLLISWDENPVNRGLDGLIREEENGKVYYRPHGKFEKIFISYTLNRYLLSFGVLFNK